MYLASDSSNSPANFLNSTRKIIPFVKAALGFAAGAGFLLAATVAQAQAPSVQVPTILEPTGSTQRLAPEIRGAPPRSLRITPAPGSVAPPDADSIRFVLAGISVVGQTIYKIAEFEEFYAELIGTAVNLTAIFEIARKIEAKYRNNGYIMTRAVVPVQTVSNNIFKIEVIEGFIDKVTIFGDAGPVRSLIERYLSKISPNTEGEAPGPTNIRDLERYLLLVNDLPGITARGIPRRLTGADAGKGATELVVEVKRKSLGLSANINNRGSRFAGPWGSEVLGVANSFTEFGERVSVSLVTALDTRNLTEQRSAKIDLEGRIGSEGLSVHAYTSFSPSRPGFTLRALQVRARVAQAGFGLNYPIIRTHDVTLRAGIEFDYTNSFVDALGARLNDDRLRVLRLNSLLDFNDSFGGFTRIQIGAHKGLNILGPTRDGRNLLSRSEGTNDFTKITVDFLRRQSLVPQFWLLLSAKYQFTNNTLLASEEFRVGGTQFGRGYNPSELSGDRGFAASVELRYANVSGFSYLREYEVYGFYDFGIVWNRDSGSIRRQSLASAGVGVKMRATKWLSANFELAKPLTLQLSTRSDKEQPVRAFFRVSAQF
jgi:hemolysin activation/secretion protein